MSIVDKLFQRQATRKATLAEQYHKVLKEITDLDNATAKQVEQLDTLTAQLGLSAEQVMEDWQTLQTLAALDPVAALVDERHKAWTAAQQRKVESQKKLDETIRTLMAEHHMVENAASNLGAKYQESHTAQRQATDIRRRAVHLFPNEPRPVNVGKTKVDSVTTIYMGQ